MKYSLVWRADLSPPVLECALLEWITPAEYYAKLQTQITNTLEADQQREKWKRPFYTNNTKVDLEKLCHATLKTPVTPATTKRQLAELISNHKKEPEPIQIVQTSYSGSGRLADISKTVTKINHLAPCDKTVRITPLPCMRIWFPDNGQ